VAAPIAGVPCRKNNNPCELVLYQSLNRESLWGGAGLSNMRPDTQKITDGWDADGDANDKMEFPNRNQLYNTTIIPDPPSFHQVSKNCTQTNQTQTLTQTQTHPAPSCVTVRLRRAAQVGHVQEADVLRRRLCQLQHQRGQ